MFNMCFVFHFVFLHFMCFCVFMFHMCFLHFICFCVFIFHMCFCVFRVFVFQVFSYLLCFVFSYFILLYVSCVFCITNLPVFTAHQRLHHIPAPEGVAAADERVQDQELEGHVEQVQQLDDHVEKLLLCE
jgi:hypothetical protein